MSKHLSERLLVFAAGIAVGMAFAPVAAIAIGLAAAVGAGLYVWRHR